MALDVWNDPGVDSLLGEIRTLAGRPEVDQFFWLKAVAARNRAADDRSHELRFFNAAAPPRNAKPPRDAVAPADGIYRIANIVLQGGGVLGIAHAGFVTGMETAGVRFAGIAGASAGAIMAMGMAAVRGDDLLTPTHRDVVAIVNAMPMSAFIDGPYRTRRLIKQFLLKRQSFLPSSWPAWLGAFRQILHQRGLNPGNAFEDWIRGVLAQHGLRTIDDLLARLRTISQQLNAAIVAARKLGQQPLSSLEPVDHEGRQLLQVMASCMPIGVKFQFPDDVRYLSGETGANSPASLVRASMSIPFFFEPAIFGVDKTNWKAFIDSKFGGLASKEKLDDFRAVNEVAFLDGGIFSNLPVDAFSAILPDVPTIAVPLMNATPTKPYRRRARLSSLAGDVGTVAFMVRDQRDRDAIDVLDRRRQVFERRQIQAGATMPAKFPFRLAAINVQDADWLNFAMGEKDQRDLFVMGLERARDFLEQDLGG
ncbi:patatin-like phospholipase family protein [Mesorhizobium sp. B2-3-4]|uniref:patatin-like phospholipase family protein n=1 Tax=Mesorhizobium sp. B2-3-4 TaxID=2589959 RepID=UPI0015E45361|nr:patatin-like phospholipase family protein [Mesorhizobium sp. B2-3-4]